MPNKSTRATLESAAATHLDRMNGDGRPESNHFVEVVFADAGEPEPLVQYQWGMMNLAGLSSVQKAGAVDFIEAHDLKLTSEGDNYVTVEGVATADSDQLSELLVEALDDVYGIALEDVETVREREL